MTARVLVPLVAPALLVGVLVGGAMAQTLDHAPVDLRITTVMKDHVSGLAWNAMKDECQRIWLGRGRHPHLG
jgi:hypothetical protein